MKTFRSILFWMHLAAGAVAGVIVLIMSVTGVALTYEKQLLESADRRAWTAPANAEQLPPEALLARVAAAQPGLPPLSLTLRSDRTAPATMMLTGNKTLLIDPSSGQIIGEPRTALRTFFRTMTSWHRYLGREGASRATGRSITGAANLVFLFIVFSGLYLWLPRVWTSIQFRNVLWFRARLAPKARDFNWHNVIGIWTALPLAIVIAGAVPISYPWASNLVYRIVGEAPPVPPVSNAPPHGAGPAPATTYVTGGVNRPVGVLAVGDHGLAHHDHQARDDGECTGDHFGRRRLRRAAAEADDIHVRSRHRCPQQD